MLTNSIERNRLGSCEQIYKFPINEKDVIWHAYLIVSSYQSKDIEYPYKEPNNYVHSFQALWFK